ncbi:HAD-IA family hydrolase [Erythrobacter crassostreae]|uniref:HAD-IA family hydrolase n=1 Tax=Erythrobacter crassostreae TaxID=2828328 RepID=A0A9X1F2Q2_9SPHN|nr:HAD-IA family hydrolase [Erythrobacter crassostrea]MBV7259216.1 HAD-IA family hydrolase [Erythrobacter crassostrea]
MKLAVFDCDGTLVDGQADICQTMVQAFERAKLAPPDANDVRRIVGLSLPVAIRHLAPDLDEDASRQVVEYYKSGYFARRQEGLLNEPLYDGITDLLHALGADGWTLAVATGKSDRGLQSVLAAHGLTDLFVSLQTADRHPSKPHPAMLEAALFEAGARPAQAVMIGDTSFDMQMGRAAGVRSIGVAWGYHPPEELLATGAEQVVDQVPNLHAVLEQPS